VLVRAQQPAGEQKSLSLQPHLGVTKSTTITVRKSNSRSGRKKGGSSLPPAINCSVRFTHTYRFYATASSTNANVTVGTLFGAAGGICTVANSTIASMAAAIRVKRIKVWSGVVSTGAVNAEVTWQEVGTNFAPDSSKEVSVPEGITSEKVLSTRPPKGSLAAFWLPNNASTGVVCQITVQAGSVLDVQLEVCLGNNFSNLAITGYSAATLSSVYYGRLDGVGGKFTPLGLPTTN